MMPAVIPLDRMLQFSQDFFKTTELLDKDGNTFGPEFEQQYAGHKNYFYYMNRNQVLRPHIITSLPFSKWCQKL